MISTHRLIALTVSALLAVLTASAEKRVQVKLQHPPTLGNALAAARVILGPVAGACAQKFSELLAVDMAAHGILVMSAQELESAAAQNHLRLSFPPDAALSAQLVKAIGPAALVSIVVNRCEARPIPPFLSGGLPAMHVARTEGHFQAAIRFIDLAKDREIVAQDIRGDSRKDNESQTGVPESPGAEEVRALALRQALEDAQHLYVPWIERREIALADDKECNLKQVFDLVKAGDYEGAARAARLSAEGCQSKSAASAWYNLGVAEMLASHYREALAALDQSLKLRDNRTVAEARNDCRAMVDAQARPSVARDLEPSGGNEQKVATQTGILLTNDIIVKLVQGNTAEDEIIKMIASQPVQFKLQADDLQKLRQSGVSDTILSAMRAKK